MKKENVIATRILEVCKNYQKAKAEEEAAVSRKSEQIQVMLSISQEIIEKIHEIGAVQIDRQDYVRLVMFNKGIPTLHCDYKNVVYPFKYYSVPSNFWNDSDLEFLAVGIYETIEDFAGDTDREHNIISYPKEWFEQEDWVVKYKEVYDSLMIEVRKEQEAKKERKEKKDRELYLKLKKKFEGQAKQ